MFLLEQEAIGFISYLATDGLAITTLFQLIFFCFCLHAALALCQVSAGEIKHAVNTPRSGKYPTVQTPWKFSEQIET